MYIYSNMYITWLPKKKTARARKYYEDLPWQSEGFHGVPRVPRPWNMGLFPDDTNPNTSKLQVPKVPQKNLDNIRIIIWGHIHGNVYICQLDPYNWVFFSPYPDQLGIAKFKLLSFLSPRLLSNIHGIFFFFQSEGVAASSRISHQM